MHARPLLYQKKNHCWSPMSASAASFWMFRGNHRYLGCGPDQVTQSPYRNQTCDLQNIIRSTNSLVAPKSQSKRTHVWDTHFFLNRKQTPDMLLENLRTKRTMWKQFPDHSCALRRIGGLNIDVEKNIVLSRWAWGVRYINDTCPSLSFSPHKQPFLLQNTKIWITETTTPWTSRFDVWIKVTQKTSLPL